MYSKKYPDKWIPSQAEVIAFLDGKFEKRPSVRAADKLTPDNWFTFGSMVRNKRIEWSEVVWALGFVPHGRSADVCDPKLCLNRPVRTIRFFVKTNAMGEGRRGRWISLPLCDECHKLEMELQNAKR